MIYGASKHPVLVKKVNIRSWTLRSELQAIVQGRLNDNNSNILDILGYFQALRSGINPATQVVNNVINFPSPSTAAAPVAAGATPPADDLEAAMAQAIADEAAGAGTPAAAPAAPADDLEAAMKEAMGGGATPEANPAGTSPTAAPAPAEVSANKDVNKLPFPEIAATRAAPAIAPGKAYLGTAFLNDMSMVDICFFSTSPYQIGQTVVIEFLIPMHFLITVEVLHCRRYNMRSRVISEDRGEYRLHGRLIFLHPGERTYLRKFLKSVEPEIKVIAKPVASADTGGGLDDLADLGL